MLGKCYIFGKYSIFGNCSQTAAGTLMSNHNRVIRLTQEQFYRYIQNLLSDFSTDKTDISSGFLICEFQLSFVKSQVTKHSIS